MCCVLRAFSSLAFEFVTFNLAQSLPTIWTKVYPSVNLVSTNVPGYFYAFWNTCSLFNHSSIYVTICLQALTEIT